MKVTQVKHLEAYMYTWTKEHKSDVRHHRSSNAFVQHVNEAGHLPGWKGTSILCKRVTKETDRL